MWKTAFEATGDVKKALIRAIEEATGKKAQYQGVPSCAYKIGNYMVTREGNLEYENEFAETEATDHLYEVLAQHGFRTGLDENEDEEDAADAPDAISVEVGLPLTGHTGSSLRNLVNLIFTRGTLINKALGTSFRVDPALVQLLQEDACVLNPERFLKTVRDYEAVAGTAIEGLAFTEDGRLNFGTLPQNSDPAVVRTFATLMAKMNQHAITSKRVLAKEITEPNEKYALRIWLTRLGMNGADYKEARAVLMRNLTGHCAFHTAEDQERWSQRQAEKRSALKVTQEEVAEG